QVVGNPYRMSPHSYGRSIDINQRENPYRVNGVWYPTATYGTWRPAGVTGMLYASGPMVRALTSRGFEWYSGWDWHHFQR
ncbi:MAG: M15 family metallopeptidase, partial [Arachnia sp.]